MNITVDERDAGSRLDVFLSEKHPDRSRSFFKALIKDDAVFVNGQSSKASYCLSAGDVIELNIPDPKPLNTISQDIPLDILYEDEDILVVNKPKGMVVHPANGHPNNTLVNALLYYCEGQLSGINGVMRPGIVHRIDKDTSGSLLVCKNDFAHIKIAAQIKEHSVTRIYNGFVNGILDKDSGRIDKPIGRDTKNRKKMAVVPSGRNAITNYRVLERFKKATYMEFRLETGRTHQIRVHMASIGHSLLGDPLYGHSKDPYHLNGQALHARIIGFKHPRTEEYIEVEAPIPEYFNDLFNKLKAH